MSISTDVLKREERAIYQLRELYKTYGYSLYKVSKFEEYDLYAHNKSFLVSQNVLTFTDTNGKLLALKPDVTLSIIKNIPDGDTVTHKLCYNENVYRPSSESDGFREIMQTGLECIGNIDLYAECEVIMLAMRSLQTISQDWMLDLSHMGLIEGLLEEAGIQISEQLAFVQLIESKNAHSLKALCDRCGISSDMKARLVAFTELYSPLAEALPVLQPMIVGEKMQQAYEHLEKIGDVMRMYGLQDRLYLDFSIVSDVNYYDGISFKGFINGVPDSVLSGGRYDRLLHRLGKSCGAIGFAVYLDRLERLEDHGTRYDVDVVLVYEEGTPVQQILETQNTLVREGKRVITTSVCDKSLRYRQLIKLTNGGVEILETND